MPKTQARMTAINLPVPCLHVSFPEAANHVQVVAGPRRKLGETESMVKPQSHVVGGVDA